MTEKSLFQLDSEVAVIASVLKNPELIHASDGLRFFMFSSSAHQIIWGEFESLVEAHFTPDPTLVIASLESKKILDKVGGRRQIEYYLNQNVDEGAFKEFIRLVMDSHKARALLSLVSSVKREDFTTANVDEYIYKVQRDISELVELGSSEESMAVADIATSAYKEIMARVNNPGIRGSTWGIDELDKATGGKCGGDLWVIGGRPGQGKTAFVCNSILQDGLNGVPALLIEREMRKQELFERLICIDSEVPNTNIRLGVLSQEQIDRIHHSAEKIKKLPIYLDTNYRASDPLYLESTITKFQKKYGIKVAYLDYIQLLAERDENQTQEIGKLSRLFKLLSNDLNICSVLLSQLNRNVESRDSKRPLASDMKQSGALEEDPDYLVGLYRDEYYNKETRFKNLMEFIILKNRNGPPGTVTLKFDGPSNKISET